MSQHRFTSGNLEVLAGWDRPLHQFFLVVEEVGGGDEPVYSNLCDPDAVGLQAVGHYQVKLAELGLSAPDGFWATIEQDRTRNAGNDVRFWNAGT